MFKCPSCGGEGTLELHRRYEGLSIHRVRDLAAFNAAGDDVGPPFEGAVDWSPIVDGSARSDEQLDIHLEIIVCTQPQCSFEIHDADLGEVVWD